LVTRWLALAPLFAGCLVSHPADEPDGAAEPIDAAVSHDAGAGRPCVPRRASISTRVEALTADASRCEPRSVEGVAIYGVEPAPEDDGIRIHADYCPGADADCRCDLVVSGVGSDLADLVRLPSGGLTVELPSDSALRITTEPTCECASCACSYALVLEAAYQPLSEAFHEIQLEPGSAVCPVSTEPCALLWSTLRATAQGESVEVPADEDRTIAGAVHVRARGSVFESAPACTTECSSCAPPRGAWVAWVPR
jgi:hypothetical protein